MWTSPSAPGAWLVAGSDVAPLALPKFGVGRLRCAGRCGIIAAMQDTPQTIPAKFPALPIGNSDWGAVKADYWSADKTQLISAGIRVLKYGVGFLGKHVALANQNEF